MTPTTTYGKGKYRAQVIDQGFEESTEKRTPCFFLQIKVLQRLDELGGLQDCPQYERTIRQYLANDTGVNILRGQLKALGVQVTSFSQLDPDTQGHVSLVGREIEVVCDIEAYQGRPQERWGLQRSRNKLAPDAVRALDDKFGHLLRDGNGQAAPAPPVTAANNSDTPF